MQQLGSQDFTRDPCPIFGHRRLDFRVPRDLETDAIVYCEAGFLAHTLYPADELPSHAFETELVGDSRVDRRHEPGRLLHQQITGRALLHFEILVRQHMRLAVHRHGQLLSRLECAQLIRCEGGDGVGGERRVLPEAFAERAIVGLRAQGDECVPPDDPGPPMTVVLNWPAALKR